MTSPAAPGVDSDARDADRQNAFAAAAATRGYIGVDRGLPAAAVDTDSDGLTDDFEKLAGMNPALADTDDDGLTDAYEAMRGHTDPTSADTDKDGISDSAEIVAGSDPGTGPAPRGTPAGKGATDAGAASGATATGVADTDHDGLTDRYENQIGSDPKNPDTDHDGLSDTVEIGLGTSPLLIDTDQDGITDASEVQLGMSPVGGGFGAAAAVVPQTATVIVVTPPAASAAPAAPAAPATPATPATPASGEAAAPASGEPGAVSDGTASGAVQHMLDAALAQVGDQYVFGAEVDVNDPNPQTWDCAELTKWAAHQAGATIPGSSFEQYLDLKAKGLLIPVDQAEHTPGALLFHFSEEPQPGGGRPDEAHVALSLGDGRTVEAQSEDVGVITDDAAGRFEYAALLPEVDYGGAGAPTPVPDTAPVDEAAATPDASGLTQDMVIYGIKTQESHGDYTAENPTSTASGAYQYIDGTWDGYGGYGHASDAPPDVQDAKMLADTQAAYDRLGDWERVIASHFAGEDGQEGPKSEWDKVPGYDYNHNPSIREYVDGVEGHIHDADPSLFAAAPAPTPDADVSAVPAAVPAAAPVEAADAAAVAGATYTIVDVTVGGPTPGTAAAGTHPGVANNETNQAALLAALQQLGVGVLPGQPGVVGGQFGAVAAPPAVPGQAAAPAEAAAHPDAPAATPPGFQIDPGVDISNPDVDSDADGLTNHFESMIGSNPTVADTDGDGLNDGMESTLDTDPLDIDSDQDGFTDGSEIHFGMDPLEPSLGAVFDAADPGGLEPTDVGDHDPPAVGADPTP